MASKTQADLQAQIDRLRARQRQLAARENKAVRARETKQKIIVGGWVKTHRPELWSEVVRSLERPSDKAAFQADAPAAAPAPAASNVAR